MIHERRKIVSRKFMESCVVSLFAMTTIFRRARHKTPNKQTLKHGGGAHLPVSSRVPQEGEPESRKVRR